ncbi:hypothetical protein AB0H36_27910 [Kribbella sp. NPDC050820]|uniref:hypothetical protein n=1 Tax=Kribbella sp. NPDC050820 TaxID=3155408 RepID=UPI0033F77B43
MTKPDPYLGLAESLLPDGQGDINETLNWIGHGEIDFNQRIALVQSFALLSIARSLRGLEQDGITTH